MNAGYEIKLLNEGIYSGIIFELAEDYLYDNVDLNRKQPSVRFADKKIGTVFKRVATTVVYG